MIGECSDYNEGDSPHSSRATVVQVESSKLMPALLVCCVIAVLVAAFAWGDARVARRDAGIAEREARIMRDELDRMKVEMEINTNH